MEENVGFVVTRRKPNHINQKDPQNPEHHYDTIMSYRVKKILYAEK